MKLVRLKTLELAAGNPITPEQQVQAAAIVASGLVSAHGIDAGGIPPSELAARALEIVNAITQAVYEPPAVPEHPIVIPPPGAGGEAVSGVITLTPV
jgi:hypothetical protein